MLETKDLILEKAKMEDAEAIYENYWKHKETAKFMLWTPCRDVNEAKERLTKVIEYQKNKEAYFVYERKSGQAIGMAAMIEIAPHIYEDGGIGIGKDFVGKGYGKQILNALLERVFCRMNAERVICSCHTDNTPSAKLQQSCGLIYTHSEMVTRKKDNLTYKADYYEITKDDYFKRKL